MAVNGRPSFEDVARSVLGKEIEEDDVDGRDPVAVAKSKIKLAPARWLDRRLRFWDDPVTVEALEERKRESNESIE